MLGAVWSALVFGLLEGTILALARLDPKILAPTKVSNDILWVTPLVHLLVYVVIGLVAALAYRWAPARLRQWPVMRLALPMYVFLGAFTALVSPRLASTLSVAVLALGLAVVSARIMSGKEDRLEGWMRRRVFWVPVVLALVAIGVQAHARLREWRTMRALAGAPSRATNVLILMLDTVRRDRFTPDRTPNLTAFAARGARFTDAWSTSSWSLPTQASALTGMHGFQHEAEFPTIALAPDVLTLGEYFQRRGYATGAFSNNSAWITPEHLGRGFARFRVYTFSDLVMRTAVGRVSERFATAIGLHKAGRGKRAPALTAQFLDFLDDYEGRPFFAYLCYMDVNRSFHKRALGHSAWEDAPPPIDVLATYDSALTALDAHVGELLAELDRRGVLEHTLVVITSDHGESFGEGVLEDHDPDGHASSLYPEQVRIPLIVVMPGTVPPDLSIDRPASLRQVPATITALLGDTSAAFPGEPLLSEDSTARALLATLDYVDRRERSVITSDWQYITYPRDPGREEFFDRRSDSSARRNLLASSPEAVARARAALDSLFPSNASDSSPTHATRAADGADQR